MYLVYPAVEVAISDSGMPRKEIIGKVMGLYRDGACWNYGLGPFILFNANKKIQNPLLNVRESNA